MMTTATTTPTSQSTFDKLIPVRHTWLAVFLPALLYYIFLSDKNSTNWSSSHGILSQLGLVPNHFTTIPTYLHVTSAGSAESGDNKASPSLLDSIFPKSPMTFEYIIQNVEDESKTETNAISETETETEASSTQIQKSKLVDTVWMEDLELGRGYLLISDVYKHGTIWRYEIGGGPIPIGKSLFMNYSGCRSNLWNPCHGNDYEAIDADFNVNNGNNYYGSGGVTIQVTKEEETFLTGQLIIVEKGERRIIRLEKDGSRTPLVLNVTTPLCAHGNGNDSSYRIQNPSLVHYTPFGDLLFTDHNTHGCSHNAENNDLTTTAVAGVYRLKEVVQVPPLSFQLSKDAHGWTETDLQKHWRGEDDGGRTTSSLSSSSSSPVMELLYSGDFEYISGIAVGKDLTSLYVAGRITHVIDENDNQNTDRNINNINKRRIRNSRYVIVKLVIDEDEEEIYNGGGDDDDDDNNDEKDDRNKNNILQHNNGDSEGNNNEEKEKKSRKNRNKGFLDEKSVIFYDMTVFFSQKAHVCQSEEIGRDDTADFDVGIALVIDNNGLIYATFPNGIAILNDSGGDDGISGTLLGTLSLNERSSFTQNPPIQKVEDDVCNGYDGKSESIIPNSINIGKDHYLYVTTERGLMRIEINTEALDHPTNLIVPSRKGH